MVYPNVLDVPNPNALTIEEIQSKRLEEYSRQTKKAKRRHLKENRVAGEGTYGTHHDELLGTSIGALRGQSKIATKARRQREEAYQHKQVNEHEALGLGGTKATQDEDSLSPTLEEAIKRGGELGKDVFVTEDEDEGVQDLNEPTNEEAVPNQGVQQPDFPTQTPPPP